MAAQNPRATGSDMPALAPDLMPAPRPMATRRSIWVDKNVRFLLVLPAVLVILLVSIFPLLYSLWVSFHLWDPIIPGNPFNGVDNFSSVLGDVEFQSALPLTFIFVAIVVPVECLFGLGLALLLAGQRLVGKRLLFSVLLLPMMMTPIVVGFTWRMLWETPFGAINQVLSFVLRHPVDIVWLNDPHTAFLAVAVTEIWQWTPFMFIVLLAAVTAVPHEHLEAAALDGAGWGKTFLHVTLPAIAPVMVLALVIRCLDAAKLFDITYALTGGGPGYSTETLSYYIYRLGAEFFQMGKASAGSYLFMIILVVLTTIFLKVAGRLGVRELE